MDSNLVSLIKENPNIKLLLPTVNASFTVSVYKSVVCRLFFTLQYYYAYVITAI